MTDASLRSTQDAIDDVIALMDDYYLTKEDWEAIVELGVGEGYEMEAALKKIDSKVKGAFTRQCVFDLSRFLPDLI